MLETVKILLCSTAEMHHQLQHLSIFAEFDYQKRQLHS